MRCLHLIPVFLFFILENLPILYFLFVAANLELALIHNLRGVSNNILALPANYTLLELVQPTQRLLAGLPTRPIPGFKTILLSSLNEGSECSTY